MTIIYALLGILAAAVIAVLYLRAWAAKTEAKPYHDWRNAR